MRGRTFVPERIRDTVCAVFVGRTVPTKETIALLSPVLVRRSVVETIVHFLVQSNPYYAPDDQEFFGFSPDNLAALFDGEDENADVGVPCAMDIGFIEDSASSNGDVQMGEAGAPEGEQPPAPKPKAKLYIGQNGPSLWRSGMQVGNPMHDGLSTSSP